MRAKRDPSVADLLEKRSAEAGLEADTGDEEAGRGRMALLAILLDWDEARGRAAIGKLAARWLENDAWTSEKPHVLQQFIGDVADKSPEVLPVFEAMAWTLAPSEYDGWSHHSGFVTTMYRNHEAALKRKGLWTNPESPWCLGNLTVRRLEDVIGYWREQELVDKPPFRALVADLLGDESECGEIYMKVDDPERWWIDVENGSAGSVIPDSGKFRLKPGESLPIRRKDVAGMALKEPRYVGDQPEEAVLEYYWPLKDRDACIARIIAGFKSSREKLETQKDE